MTCWPATRRAGKAAFIDAASGAQLTYGELADRPTAAPTHLRAQGFAPESRVMVAMLDTPTGRWCFSAASWRASCPSPPTRC
jgi:acyl-CoA synthetase (AMP-forming)/AMP-acid ligase II